MDERLRITKLLLAMWLIAFFCPRSSFAQCSVGTPVYHDCFNVTFQGCCTSGQTDAGRVDVLQWCENGFLCQAICNPFEYQNAYCGWNSQYGIYDCGPSRAQDPSLIHPYECNIPCNGVTEAGCCEGQTLLKYCKQGRLVIINCAANQGSYKFCGWDPVYQGYACTVSPAEGPPGYPYQCYGTTPCVPSCYGKECGDDGCGSVCGNCPSNEVCQNGVCVPLCQRKCEGKECGPDGCGGTCGQCPPDFACSEQGLCVKPPCIPDCKNKECGSDLCGGSCGVCQPPKTCSPYFKCVLPEDIIPRDYDVHVTQDEPTRDEQLADPFYFETAPIFICPDGFVAKYGQCVPANQSKSRSASCSASDSSSLSLSIFLLGFLGLLGIRRTIRGNPR
jgi:hypothetical protein